MKPLIAVAGRSVPPGVVLQWNDGAVAAPSQYIQALHRAGGQEGVLLPAALSPEEAAERLERFDGLLLLGGGDVDPELYADARHPAVEGVHRLRDDFEMTLIRAAVERRMPTLAVCRGLQVMNMALGGTLEQHIDETQDDPILHAKRNLHDVSLEPGSQTALAMGTERAACHSAHHQAVGKLGDGLVATGWAEDGVIEAAELEEGWVVGVQWHPERTAEQDPVQQGLFTALVEHAANNQ